jgi:Rad3-related DNA helicase
MDQRGDTQEGGDPQVEREVLPWVSLPGGVAFVVFGGEGPDPGRDQLNWVEALRVDTGGKAETFERRHCGNDAADAATLWNELAAFAGERLVVVAEGAAFRSWNDFFDTRAGSLGRAMGIDEIAALLSPARGREEVALDADSADLRRSLGDLARGFFGLERDALHALSVAFATTWSRLSASDAAAAEHLTRVLSLLACAQNWIDGPELPASARFESDPVEAEYLTVLLDDLQPAWTHDAKAWHAIEPLPPNREGALPWNEEDECKLEATFTEELPGLFAGTDNYREGQHTVARELAANFGRKGEAETQLLLMHAPTGTGKTLAYLVPAMIWARRHEVRVGIATYTRALQEQAIDREVPRALEALGRVGLAPGLRVSMLKGRENYLCWRTLRMHVPTFDAPGEAWLAFSQVLAFALTSATGDLDRLPRRAPLKLEQGRGYRATLADLLRQVRGRTSCCRAKEDRTTCAAEAARHRAERSHLVVTNHSFALARQEFFRHVVFDECEHLHDQAHSAWSHTVDMSQVRALLDRLYKPEQSRSRSLFRRIAKRLVQGTPSWDTLDSCQELWTALHVAQGELAEELAKFDAWRRARARERDEREDHSLLREYAEAEAGAALITRRTRLCRIGNQLDEKLAELSERLEKLAIGRLARLRRSIELARTDLVEILDGVSAWLPLQEGKPSFSARTFHDVEVGPNGMQLAARVLLPNEYLGRFYYPQLSTAAFLSATTHMKDGFDAATSYLGLDRAVETCEEDPDLLCKLRTFRAPEVFDYSRVLVSVPRDAPSVSRDKQAFLEYARDFLAELGDRTRGRILGLFTNAEDVKQLGARLEGHFRARRIPFWYQNMPGTGKEEMSELFRRRTDSVLLGVDTFWYGADFPGETLEHLVLGRLPYGVPDRYHHAQCAVLGISEQRRQIYMPRALAKFRQGFGRLMRRLDDRGCVYVLDNRIVEPRSRAFLRELPVCGVGESADGLASLVRGDTQRCLEQAMAHVGLGAAPKPLEVAEPPTKIIERFDPDHGSSPDSVHEPEPLSVDLEDLPF